MTDFDYTIEFDDFDSSVVDAAYYNENDQTLVLEMSNNYYRYSGVPKVEAAAIENVVSVGSDWLPRIKRTYGPSENLGSFWDVDENWVPVAKEEPVLVNSSPNGSWTSANNTAVISLGGREAPTSYVSLSDPGLEGKPALRKFTVAFTSGETDKVLDHTLYATDWNNAAEETVKVGAMFNLRLDVKGVSVVD